MRGIILRDTARRTGTVADNGPKSSLKRRKRSKRKFRIILMPPTKCRLGQHAFRRREVRGSGFFALLLKHRSSGVRLPDGEPLVFGYPEA